MSIKTQTTHALTAHGAQYYAALLQSPYKVLDNGNIEVFCDDHRLGEHFTLAAAGAISLSAYKKLFTSAELVERRI